MLLYTLRYLTKTLKEHRNSNDSNNGRAETVLVFGFPCFYFVVLTCFDFENANDKNGLKAK